jgi:hypothetical protein
MRAALGKLFLAENKNGRASMVTINGDHATATTLLDGLTTPTAIEAAGDTLWVGDRGIEQRRSPFQCRNSAAAKPVTTLTCSIVTWSQISNIATADGTSLKLMFAPG